MVLACSILNVQLLLKTWIFGSEHAFLGGDGHAFFGLKWLRHVFGAELYKGLTLDFEMRFLQLKFCFPRSQAGRPGVYLCELEHLLWEDFESSRHSCTEAERAVLLCGTSWMEWFSLFHPTLLEGVLARGCCCLPKKAVNDDVRKTDWKQWPAMEEMSPTACIL